MIPPDERPEITNPETRAGNETTPDVSPTGRFPSALASVKAWLRSSIDSNSAPSLPQRIPPKMRMAQLGTAVAAVGVLGVALGGADSTAGQDVRLATETAPASQTGQHAAGQTAAVDPVASTGQSDSRDKSASANTPGGMVSKNRNGSTDRKEAKDRKTEQRDSQQRDNSQQDKKDSGTNNDTPKGSADQQDKQRGGKDKQEEPAEQPQPAPPPEPAEDQIDAWINEASAVLERNGYRDHQINEDHIRTIILKESGGDPAATNNWDSNAAKGTPSKGLMQTIDPTFESYALPGHENVWDPVDNIIAASRYSVDRYGSVSSVPGITGMQSGGSYEGY